MTPGPTVALLSSFKVELPNGVMARFRTRRAEEVVARLALQPSRQLSREELATDIWPDAVLSKGLANLRPALSYARLALGNVESIVSDGAFVRLSSEIHTDWSDLERFEALVRTATTSEERLIRLFTLNERIQRPLLGNWKGEWLDGVRHYHHQRRLKVLRQLGEELGSRGDWEATLDYAKRMSELEVTSEEAVRLQLRCWAEMDKLEEARLTYALYVRNLDNELGLKPSQSLREFAKAVVKGSARGSGLRPLTSLQQEFIHHSLELLAEHEPERLLPLFASGRLNWSVVLHGVEMRPYLERAISATTGWTLERAGVAKRLLQVYGQELEFEPMLSLASQLLESKEFNDQIAALNYLSWANRERKGYDAARSHLEAAIEIGQRANDEYLVAISQTNRGILEVTIENYNAAIFDLIQVRDTLKARNELNARYSSSTANGWLVGAHLGMGNIPEAKKCGEEWLEFAEVHGVLTHDADGKATYGAVAAYSGDRATAANWLIQSIDTAIAGRRKINLEAVAVQVVGAMNRLGMKGKAAQGAASIRRIVRQNGRLMSPYSDRLLAETPSFDGKSLHDSMSDLLVSCKDALLTV